MLLESGHNSRRGFAESPRRSNRGVLRLLLTVTIVSILLPTTVESFVTTPRSTTAPPRSATLTRENTIDQRIYHKCVSPSKTPSSSTSSSTFLSMLSPGVGGSLFRLVPARLSLLVVAAVALLFNAQKWLWPRSQADPNYTEPVPPGSLGCPFIGTPFFWGSKRWGAGSFYRTRVRQLENWPKIFKYYFLGVPFVAMSGYKRLQKVLSKEFEVNGLQAATVRRRNSSLLGPHSIVAETSKQQHQFLRRLIGQALTPTAVAASIPILQTAAQVQVDHLIQQSKTSSTPIQMDRVCTDFTLDVAWKQILGLNLADDEVPTFTEAVADWINGIATPQAILGIGLERTKGYKAFQYLESKVNEKIDDLEQNGPDGVSTLSGMLFASDDEEGASDDASTLDASGSRRKLSRRQVVDNAMILILAGSETSASTLTNAMAFLGLHKDRWYKLVEEQKVMRAKHGDALTKDALDKECPYLEAVIKESLRLRPISGGIPRQVKETMVIDGQQIPKGWMVDWSAALTHELDPKTFQPDGSHMDVKLGFVPERWLSEETTPVDFVPMGVGPRYCLGANLAYAEMKVFLALLARNVDFDLAGDTDNIVWKRMSIIPKIEDGVPIVVGPLQAVASSPSMPVAVNA